MERDNNSSKSKVKDFTFVIIIGIVLVYVFFFWIERFIRPKVEDFFTSDLQERYYVKTTLQQVDTGLIENYDSYNADYYIKPVSFAISIIIVVLLSGGLIVAFFLFIKKNKWINSKFDIRFNSHVLYICKWIIEAFVLLCGIFIAVYGYAKIDARKYGIDKTKLQQDTAYKYYLVEEIPYAVNYLVNENLDNSNEYEDERNKQTFVTWVSNRFDEICLFVALLGCFVFSLNFIIDYEEGYSVSVPNQYELINDVIEDKKIKAEIKKEVLDYLNVEMSKKYDRMEKTILKKVSR